MTNDAMTLKSDKSAGKSCCKYDKESPLVRWSNIQGLRKQVSSVHYATESLQEKAGQQSIALVT